MFYDLFMTCMLKHIFVICMLKLMFMWAEENKHVLMYLWEVFTYLVMEHFYMLKITSNLAA